MPAMELTDEDRAAISALFDCGQCEAAMIEEVEAFYLAGKRAGMERAAKICRGKEDDADWYNRDLYYISAAIELATEIEAAAKGGKVSPNGCGRRLAADQYWTFCGETDMGQTAPALCTECGGEFKLAE